MTEKLDKYILDIQIDNETGEEHCTILKTDNTTNMDDWITIISAMYAHHSVFEPLLKELNKLSDENEQLKSENQEMSNIISAIEKGSCRSIDSFLDDYCTDEILKEFDLE